MVSEAVLFLEDILHTGNSGPEFTSKIGIKYDQRRNLYCVLQSVESSFGIHMLIFEFDTPKLDNMVHFVTTTPLVTIYEEGDYMMMRTVNSIYKFRKVKDDED